MSRFHDDLPDIVPLSEFSSSSRPPPPRRLTKEEKERQRFLEQWDRERKLREEQSLRVMVEAIEEGKRRAQMVADDFIARGIVIEEKDPETIRRERDIARAARLARESELVETMMEGSESLPPANNLPTLGSQDSGSRPADRPALDRMREAAKRNADREREEPRGADGEKPARPGS